MSKIVLISGSPSESSRSDIVLDYLAEQLKEQGVLVHQLSVQDVPPEVLVSADYESPVIRKISSIIGGADGVIVASPVYKAAYTGVLKALIDILPQDILKEKPVLPIMVGGSPNHLLAIEYSLKPLLATVKGQNLQGVYFIDSQIDKQNPRQPILNTEVSERLTKQLNYLVEIAGKQKETSQ